jgi:hypothetical protein
LTILHANRRAVTAISVTSDEGRDRLRAMAQQDLLRRHRMGATFKAAEACYTELLW